MIERDGPLSLSRQCALLGVSRSSQYYRPKGESAEDLALMRRMDELHMAYPFYGSRQLMRHLRREGVAAGRHRIRRLDLPPRAVPHPMLVPAPVEGGEGRASSGTRATA